MPPLFVLFGSPCSGRSVAPIRGRQARRPTGGTVLCGSARRGRLSSCRPHAVWGSIALAALTLGVPVIAAVNPVDPSWIPGFYDDGDYDQLVSHAISPESWLGVVLEVVLCLLASIALARWSRPTYGGAHRREPVARAPPGRSSVFRACHGHLIIRPALSFSRSHRPSVSGGDTAGPVDTEQSSRLLVASLPGMTTPSTKCRGRSHLDAHRLESRP
jgi:hypothetical protein